MKFKLNGQEKEYSGDGDLLLLTYLRENEGVTSVKDGCSGQASCGACTVDVDGKSKLSCATKMSKVDGTTITTTDGLGEYRQEVYANAFVEKGGVQCGFCIPGIVMRADTLINKNDSPSEADIVKSLTPHLCRCTGYKKIIESVQYAADAIREDARIEKPTSNGRIGTRTPKYDAQDLVLGFHDYTDDFRLENMKHGALRYSDHPRAKLLSLDTSAAEAMEGVIRVLTAADVPGERNIGLIRQDWPVMVAVGETTNYVGDVIASVVAETEAIARAAVALITAEYEVYEPVTDMHDALKPESPIIHGETNILAKTTTSRGDMAKAKAESAFTAQAVFQTQRIEHAYMEPESAVARLAGNGVELFSQGQGIYEDRIQIAKLLGLPQDRVRVVLVPNGGGFGGKEDLTVQGHAAIMTTLVGDPVKVHLTRDESIMMSPKRHPIWMDYNVGCDDKGMLTYVDVKFVGDTGAYASVGMKVLERSAGHATGAYNVPVTDVVATAVYTNNAPCGAMRGFGVNQAIFGLESLIDELCEQGNFDRWQFRYDNALTNGDMTATGQVIEGGAAARETLEAVKDAFYAAKYAGIACGLKNTGIGNGMPDFAKVAITIAAEDEVIIDHSWTEMGQGVHTMALQTLCEETGIDPAIITVRTDTKADQDGGMTTASRGTSLVGNGTIDAAKGLKADLQTKTLADLVGNVYQGEWRVEWTTKPGAMVEKVYTHYSYSYATQLVTLDDNGKIEKITAAHDAGRIFNPTLFEGQLEGSLHMGLGYAISEDMVWENGRPAHTNLRKLGVLRARETPEMEIIGVEVADPYGPYGAKGVGEIGLVPTAGAVANAFFQFDGKRRRSLPMDVIKK